MAEQAPIIRQSADRGVRYFEMNIGGEWVVLGSLIPWLYPSSDKKEGFQEMADRCMALFLAAPAMLETLRLILDGEMVSHDHLTQLIAQARGQEVEA